MARLLPLAAIVALLGQPVTAQEITVTPLNQINTNAVGLVTPQNAGIPADFWGDASAPLIAHLIDIQHHHQIPEARAFLSRLLVTELNSTKDDDNGVTLILSRVDWLLDNGALDAADALLEKAGIQHPALFQRWFDSKLMLGNPDEACAPLKENPALATDLSTKVYCLAQNSDWFSAELTLVTGRNLGGIDPRRADLLSIFLDPELMGESDPPPIQNASDPLEFALREALALPRPGSGLTLSQSHVDLDDSAGWLAQLRAGENLARVGAIPARYLDALYSDGYASASGGVWERVQAVSKLKSALTKNSSELVCQALDNAWQEMKKAKLLNVFSEIFAEQLAGQNLPESCLNLQVQTILLHHNYGALLFDLIDFIPETDILRAILDQDFTATETNSVIEKALVDAFLETREPLSNPAQSILTALAETTHGIESSPRSIKRLVSTLLNADFKPEAQRLALQYIILERAS
jgi:hypothetical protein